MNKVIVPSGYQPALNSYDLQRAIARIKQMFQQEFTERLHFSFIATVLTARKKQILLWVGYLKNLPNWGS